MAELLGKEEIPLKPDLSFYQVPTNIGIELELENWCHDRGIDGSLWTEDRDGSLRNNGVELISKVLSGYKVIAALRQFAKHVAENQEPVANERCSFHLHLDVLDLTLQEFINLTYIAGAVEPLMMSLCQEHRQCSSFALPLSKAPRVLTTLRDGVHNWSYDHWRNLHDWGCLSLDDYKYGAMNFASVGIHGTVEFRMHHGTFDVQEIRDWIQLCVMYKEWAKKYDNLDDLSVALRSSLLDELHEKVHSLHYPARSRSQLLGLVEEGIEIVDVLKEPPQARDYNPMAILEKFRISEQECPFDVIRNLNRVDVVAEEQEEIVPVTSAGLELPQHGASHPFNRNLRYFAPAASWLPREHTVWLTQPVVQEATEWEPEPEPTPAPPVPEEEHVVANRSVLRRALFGV
jgi:hypothetical protein